MTRSKLRLEKPDWKALLADDADLMREIVRAAVTEVLEVEMTEALGAERGERSETRLGYRAGYYQRSLVTRVGKLELRVPRDRDGRFSTQLFERYSRSEKALVGALAEMYVQGVSTRKVIEVLQRLVGPEVSISSTPVSRATERLDEWLAAWRGRPLGVPPLCAAGCALRARARGRAGGRLRGVGGGRHHRKRSPSRAGRVGGAVGGRSALARLPGRSGQARADRCEAHRLRRPRGLESGASGGAARCAVATVPISSAAKRTGLRHQARSARTDRRPRYRRRRRHAGACARGAHAEQLAVPELGGALALGTWRGA